eukprot:Em0009g635a
MLHSACHIADVLLSLQRAGNVKYFGWKMQFPCSASVVDELQAVVKDMENDMQRWKDDVKESREKFYELNNFTTAQLVLLRRELGKLSGANDVGESSEESEAESMETTDDHSVHRRGIEGLPIDHDLSKVMVTKMKPINSSHPAVQELVLTA